MKERAIERYLVQRVRRLGGECLKFTSPGRIGVPDRIVMLPGGELTFVETKRPEGGVLSEPQKRCHARLRELMQEVRVLSTKEGIDDYLKVE